MAGAVLEAGPGIAEPFIKNPDSKKTFDTVTGITHKAGEVIKKVDQ